MNLKTLSRSSAFRLATALSALFGGAMGLIMLLVYLRTGEQMRDNLDVSAQTELGELMIEWSQGGVDNLRKMLWAEVAPGSTDDSVYVLQDPDGKILAGNAVQPLPAKIGLSLLPREQLHLDVPPESVDDANDLFHVAGASLGSYYVAVGISDSQVTKAMHSMLKVFATGLIATIAVCVALGLYLSQRMHRRIEAIRLALVQVAGGDLSHAVPGADRRDDVGGVVVLINQTVTALRRVVDAMQQLSNDVTHDLKRPLARLRQQLSLSQYSLQQGKDPAEHIEGAERHARSMQGIFESLLRITHVESGIRRARLRKVDLHSLLADLHQTFEPVAVESAHSLTAELGAQPVDVLGDQDLLTQLFVNLIENAICHTPAGTRIELRLAAEDGKVVASVADNGPGIPEGERGLVTRRFYRLERSRTTEGHGLGLSLVSAVAALHGASLEIGDAKPGLVVSLRFTRAEG